MPSRGSRARSRSRDRGPEVPYRLERNGRTMITRTSLLLLTVLAAATPHRGAAASADPYKAARKCRGAIAKGATLVTGVGLATLDSCHKRRDQGKFQGDCNVLDGNANFSRAEARAQGLI